MCKFCTQPDNAFVPLNDTAAYSGIEMSLNCQGMLKVRYYGSGSIRYESQDIVNIRHCPACGREFEKDE